VDRSCGTHGIKTEISAGSEGSRIIGRPRPGWEKILISFKSSWKLSPVKQLLLKEG
jgi:hypothetical protein